MKEKIMSEEIKLLPCKYCNRLALKVGGNNECCCGNAGCDKNSIIMGYEDWNEFNDRRFDIDAVMEKIEKKSHLEDEEYLGAGVYNCWVEIMDVRQILEEYFGRNR